MCKFSIIVPVYNVENYLDKCLNSILNQDYDDYEIIVINDGSTDSSREILKKFEKNSKIKIIDEENSGLSAARNNGIKEAQGEYLLFVDSDDYILPGLLKHLSSIIIHDYDLIKFQYEEIYEDKTIAFKDEIELKKEYAGLEFFMKEVETHKPFEMAWLYAYRKNFWTQNNFSYREKAYHEDFGLTPLIILKAKSVFISNYVGYCYNQMGSSIVRTNDYNKTLKKAYDYLIHFDYLFESAKHIAMDIKTRKYFHSYLANGVIDKYKSLNKEDKKKYSEEMKKRKITSLLIDDSLIRKIKKVYNKIKY